MLTSLKKKKYIVIDNGQWWLFAKDELHKTYTVINVNCKVYYYIFCMMRKMFNSYTN